MELHARQQDAVDLIASGEHRVGIITGGPGTGKTTCLRQALAALEAKREYATLLAPTGKAARRMQEACNHPASTIHRAVGYTGESFGEDSWIPGEVVLVDEASMVDTELLDALLNNIDTRRQRIFFVGDVNQLPSVGPGYVLGDMIDSGVVPTVQLTEVHRSAQGSWMNRNAPRILAGDYDGLELDTREDFAFIRIGPDSAERLVEVIENELNWVGSRFDGIETMQQALDRVQVLIPQKRGPLGVNRANAMLQDAMQGGVPDRGGWSLPSDTVLFDGDKVMQTKNDYELGLMNGEQGFVAGQAGRELVVDVGTESHHYSREQSWNLTLSYATTIHKSQGSEWPVVVVLCHSSHGRMLGRQLIYTAVTRAKKRVVLLGDDEGLKRALSNDRVQERQTGLKDSLVTLGS